LSHCQPDLCGRSRCAEESCPRRNHSRPFDEGGATGRGKPIKPSFDTLEPTIDISLKDFGGVRSKSLKVPRTTRRAREGIGHGKRLLSIGGHLGHPSRTPHNGIPLPPTMLLDDARTSFGVAPRLPWRRLRHYVNPTLGGDSEKAKAEKSAELFHTGVILPAPSPFGGADREPNLIAGGRAINGLKDQFQREALLHLADHDDFGQAIGKRHEIAAAYLPLYLQAEPLQMELDGRIKVSFQGRSVSTRSRDQLGGASLTLRARRAIRAIATRRNAIFISLSEMAASP
jgi:hypothetical protein